MSGIEIDTATFAAIIREQQGLPITGAEAEAIARALETCHDDGEFLATALSAVRLLADRLETDRLEESADDGLAPCDSRGLRRPQPLAVATPLKIVPPPVRETVLPQ